MQEIAMLDTIERYIRGEMLPEERVFFEQLRKSNAAVDQMVVEHTIFLNQINKFAEIRHLKTSLSEVHEQLFETGALKEKQEARVVRIWKRYKKVVAVAASIAGITALGISGIVSYLSPKPDPKLLIQLGRHISALEIKTKTLSDKVDEYKPKGPSEGTVKLGGTGFLIDGKGCIVTNAHVVENASAVTVQNSKGQEFNCKVIYIDPVSDIALLKVTDPDFKAYTILPYGISKFSSDLGSPIFTLGYPRDEIVYGEGYLSAKTGYNGDTLACQIAVVANPGNSGAPVLDKNGDVIGVLSTRQAQAQGVVFAIKAKNIYRALDELKDDSLAIKSDSTLINLKISSVSTVKGLERTQQIKKIEDCIFLVKSY